VLALLLLTAFAEPPASASGSPPELVTLRLRPGDDLREALEREAAARQWTAAAVLTAVGSLTHASLRFADAEASTRVRGPLEVVSLVGTLGPDGVHLHLSVADRRGRMTGGHLTAGSEVYTTVELVIAVSPDLRFNRVVDPATGHRELAPTAAPDPR
jgi:predicted DNA-binding protein with PD1-like motif